METPRSHGVRMTTASKSEITSTRMLLYSMSGFGIGCADYIVAVYLLKYYTDHVTLNAALAGAALMIGKLLDGVSDPIMGFISLRTELHRDVLRR